MGTVLPFPVRRQQSAPSGARVWHVSVLVNAGAPYEGQWAPLPRWYASEPEAWRAVEDLRITDRALSPTGLARSYRVTASVTEVAPAADGGWADFARDFDAFLKGEQR